MNTRFAKYIDRAAKYYRKDKRYYHTIYHVLNMFEQFSAFEKEWDKEFTHLETDWLYNDNRKEELFWSIAFHDAYYMPGFVKNEAFSADKPMWNCLTNFLMVILIFRVLKIISFLLYLQTPILIELSILKMDSINWYTTP